MEQEAQVQTTKNERPGSVRRKVTSVLSTVALAVALILCVVVVAQVLVQGYVSVGGFSLFRVVTPSMEPTMPVGCLLISQDVPISEIKVDDIVVFKSKAIETRGGPVTHRVVQIMSDGNGEVALVTKGDANTAPDGNYVKQDNLIGRVIFHTEDGNFLSGLVKILTDPIGFFAAIVIPCLVIGVLLMRGTIATIYKEMNVLTTELHEQEKENKKQETAKKKQEEKEYQELCDRLRAELLEEMKQSADQEETTE